MRSVNKVILIGNLTRDPEVKTTLGNQHIATFGIATNRDWMTKDFRKESSVEFHELVCFGGLADIAEQHLKKGKLVHVSGYLKTRSWDDATGQKRFRTEIVVEDLIMLEKRPKDNQFSEAPTHSSSDIPDDDFRPSIQIENPTTI